MPSRAHCLSDLLRTRPDVKRLAKNVLYRVGVGPTAERLFFNLRSMTPKVLKEEVRIRLLDSEPLPVPPGALIYDVIACRWAGVYLESGHIVFDALIRTLQTAGYRPRSGDRLLDFGCGCARLTRRLIADTPADVFGSDYNPRLVAWCRENLTGGTFSQNDLEPPLPYPDAMFDLVIARSVFTHLTEELQVRWMAEMRRVIRPGGLLYFSMHGPFLAAGLDRESRRRLESGELVVTYRSAEGANLCSSFAHPEFVHRALLQGFGLERYEPGVPQEHRRQDVYVVRRLPES